MYGDKILSWYEPRTARGPSVMFSNANIIAFIIASELKSPGD